MYNMYDHAGQRHTEGMRAPKRRKPPSRKIVEPDEGVSLESLAEQVRYVGSPEHKVAVSFAGPPRLRADASQCDPRLGDPQELTEWLREAIRAGHIGGYFEGDFPRYVWVRRDSVVYEGRLVNFVLGEYKGYPLAPHEYPAGL
jgi:hypothetical protein